MGKPLQAVPDYSRYIAFPDLGLHPVLLSLGGHPILRWYSLAYLAGIFLGYWYMLKLLKQPGEHDELHPSEAQTSASVDVAQIAAAQDSA